MASVQRISPCLWFDGQAEAAAAFYTSVFPAARIEAVAYYTETGRAIHGHDPGTVLTVQFTLDGMRFTALNGGSQFRFSEAVSLQVLCADQAEIDYYWDALGAGGDEAARQCGWLKDRFGLSWQVVPRALAQWLAGPASAATERVLAALMEMKKLDVAALERAYVGR